MADGRSGGTVPGTDYLFVYGTLMKKSGHSMHGLLEAFARYVGEGELDGQLYDLGEYPGLVQTKGCQARVRGEVYRLQNLEKAFEVLDEYEGPEYRREKRTVRLNGGEELEAWVYLYEGPTEGAKAVESGEWKC